MAMKINPHPNGIPNGENPSTQQATATPMNPSLVNPAAKIASQILFGVVLIILWF